MLVVGLTDELSKIRREIEKKTVIAEVLLVLDATTRQNGLAQAEAFIQHAVITGLVLTKLDGLERPSRAGRDDDGVCHR